MKNEKRARRVSDARTGGRIVSSSPAAAVEDKKL
jgi:hypothetical protein